MAAISGKIETGGYDQFNDPLQVHLSEYNINISIAFITSMKPYNFKQVLNSFSGIGGGSSQPTELERHVHRHFGDFVRHCYGGVSRAHRHTGRSWTSTQRPANNIARCHFRSA